MHVCTWHACTHTDTQTHTHAYIRTHKNTHVHITVVKITVKNLGNWNENIGRLSIYTKKIKIKQNIGG